MIIMLLTSAFDILLFSGAFGKEHSHIITYGKQDQCDVTPLKAIYLFTGTTEVNGRRQMTVMAFILL